MKQSAFFSTAGQRLFTFLYWAALILVLPAGILVIASLESAAGATGLSRSQVLLLNLLPFGHFIFFILFFRLLAGLFKGLGERTVFQDELGRANHYLFRLCLAYAAYNLVLLFLMGGLLFSPPDSPWFAFLLEPANVQYGITIAFILVLTAIFHFNSRVLSQGMILQREQDLTI